MSNEKTTKRTPKATALGRRVVYGFEEKADKIRKAKLEAINEVLMQWNNAISDGSLVFKPSVQKLTVAVGEILASRAAADADLKGHETISREMVYANGFKEAIEALRHRWQRVREEEKTAPAQDAAVEETEATRLATLQQAVIAAQIYADEWRGKCQDLERLIHKANAQKAVDDEYIAHLEAALMAAQSEVQRIAKSLPPNERAKVIDFPAPKRITPQTDNTG